jgi:hypothetical protein
MAPRGSSTHDLPKSHLLISQILKNFKVKIT